MHFGENQLSPSLIGLSPLTTGHPPCFQPWWVRPSTGSYARFSLPMARSLGSGSPIRVNLATHGNSLAHSSKGTPSRPIPEGIDDALTVCKPTVSGTISLPSRGAFHLSLTVLVHYRSPVSTYPYEVVSADSHR